MKGVNPETRNRIRVAVAAYAYEFENDPIMSDAEFDKLAESIDTETATGNPDLDHFFWTFFSPITGMWVREHPEIDGLRRIYQTIFNRPDPEIEELL